MQISLSLPKPQSPAFEAIAAIKNIFIRHSCSKQIKFNINAEHPEISHLLKYAPKYYSSFAIQIIPHYHLISKIKKIKKLKTFTTSFQKPLPPKLWFNILANNRKEIEEVPQIIPADRNLKLSKSFWKRLNLLKIKFLPNMKKLSIPKMFESDPYDSFLHIQMNSVKYLCNMRKLKSVEIISGRNYRKIERLLQKLDGMCSFLARLETFIVEFRTRHHNVQNLLQYKNVLSHLTSLKLQARLNIINNETQQICKNLKVLSLGAGNDLPEKPQFQNFLTSIQHFSQPKSLEFKSPKNGRLFWEYFKPQSSLYSLKIRFSVSGDLKKELLIKQWEEITELGFLQLTISYAETEELHFVKVIVTIILTKIRKLRSLKLQILPPPGYYDHSSEFEPFLVKEISHLYESLEKFEFSVKNWSCIFPKFDLKILSLFCNLKVLKVKESKGNLFKNVEEAVSLLQGN